MLPAINCTGINYNSGKDLIEKLIKYKELKFFMWMLGKTNSYELYLQIIEELDQKGYIKNTLYYLAGHAGISFEEMRQYEKTVLK